MGNRRIEAQRLPQADRANFENFFDLPLRLPYGLAMPDQYGVLTRLLQKSEFAGWHGVQPTPGDLSGGVWIQNSDKSLDAYVPLSTADVDDMTEDEMIARIERAIAKAKSRK
jgi:hypothetical protein